MKLLPKWFEVNRRNALFCNLTDEFMSVMKDNFLLRSKIATVDGLSRKIALQLSTESYDILKVLASSADYEDLDIIMPEYVGCPFLSYDCLTVRGYNHAVVGTLIYMQNKGLLKFNHEYLFKIGKFYIGSNITIGEHHPCIETKHNNAVRLTKLFNSIRGRKRVVKAYKSIIKKHTGGYYLALGVNKDDLMVDNSWAEQ